MQNRTRWLAAASFVAGTLFYTLLDDAESAVDTRHTDRAGNSALRRVKPSTQSVAAHLDAVLAARGLRVSSRDEGDGRPTFLWATQPEGASTSGSAPSRASAIEAARRHVAKLADVYGIEADDALQLPVRHAQVGAATLVSLGAEIDGVEVFRSALSVVMNNALSLVAISGRLPTSEALEAAQAYKPVSAPAALAGALEQDPVTQRLTFTQLDEAGPYVRFRLAAGGKDVGTARVKRVFMEQAAGLVPAYYVEVDGPSAADSEPNYRARVIDARRGALLFSNHLVAADSYTYRIFGDATPPYIPADGPHAGATPHPTASPSGFQPLFQPAALVTLQNSPFSRNDPWLAPNSQVLAGNNVWAYLDIAAPDGFQRHADLDVVATGPGTFDYTYNPSLPPQASLAQRAAAATHAFHVTNFLHDRFYDAGFDESAGNAQASNYGRGGLGDDRLLVEVHDHARRNSSRAVVPADGASPRIELGLYDGPAVLTLSAPGSVAGTYNVVAAPDIGAQVYDLSAKLVLPSASSAPGCDSLPADSVAGHIVMLDAGGCDVALKAEHAQAAGAVAVLVAGADTHVAAALEGSSTSIAIPVLSLTGRLGNAIKQAINGQQAEVLVQVSRSDFDRDAALDSTLIAHEWGHVMTRRLIGDGSGLENAQGRAIDEGYADFVALWTVVRDSDRNVQGNNNWQGVFAVGGHVMGGGVTDGHYFGLRRVPYSTDMSKNALTFKHVARGASLPGNHPVAATSSTAGADNASPHHSGEVWATMLWECYVSLLNAHPFQEAQDRMQRYVADGLRATPIDPTFVEARDALLAVTAANDPADFQRFRAAFAKRGLGVGAAAPARDSLDHAGVVESYVASDVRLVLTDVQLLEDGVACPDGVLDLNEPGQLRITLTNRGTINSESTSVSVSGRNGTQLHFPNTDQAYFPSIPPGASVTANLPVVLSALTGTQAEFALGVPTAWGSSEAHNVALPANWVAALGNRALETFDVAGPEWAASPASGARSFQRVSTREGEHYYHAAALSGPGEAMLLTPPIFTALSGEFALQFQMRHSFEDGFGRAPYRTGMVLEVSVDGAPFEDIAFDEDPGYSGVVHAASQNPLAGRPAFVGSSEGYPAAWQTVSVNLGTRYAGRTLRFRFRLGTDGTGSTYGVDIDNFSISNSELPFFKRLSKGPAGGGADCNRPPVVNAGPDQRVSEFEGNPADGVRRVVQLSAQSSFDPDGDALSYYWWQLFGPPVTLSAADEPNVSFTANVNADVTLIFWLTVSDGVSEVRDYVEVEVKHFALAPVAQITGEASVSERSGLVTLDGTSSSHPEGHALSYHWTQTAGPVVSFDASAASIEYMPPEVDADTTLSFTLVVTADGVDSAPASFTLTVLEVDRAPSVSVVSDALALQAGALATAVATGIDPDGTAVSYVWTQTAGPELTLYGASEARVFFAAPEVSSNTSFTLQVRARSGGLESEPASITFEVSPRAIGDRAPEVSLASKLECQAGERCSLRASASDPDDDALAYSWLQLTGPSVSLQSSTSDTLAFEAPEVARATVFGFALTVTANGASTSAGVVVVVHPAETAPDAGVVDPGEEPEPNSDAGVGPGDDPGTDPGDDSGTDPGDGDPEPAAKTAGSGCSVSANGGGAPVWQFLAALFGLAALRRRRPG